ATGGTNITGGASLDGETGILYVSSVKACTSHLLVPGAERDRPNNALGVTVADWQRGPGRMPSLQGGLPILKPPYGRITALDMNTGETLWWIPNGETPDRIKNHPLLAGLDIGNTGQSTQAHPMVMGDLLIYGEGRG